MTDYRPIIEAAWEDRSLLEQAETQDAIRAVINQIDAGELRCAAPSEEGWIINEWVKKAVVLYFPIQKMETLEAGIFEYHDKMPLKRGYKEKGIRVVPTAVARHGAHIAPGTILMPSYVNIGAYVDSGTMVDTWATVGSCAQIGKNVHLSGGVGIGNKAWSTCLPRIKSSAASARIAMGATFVNPIRISRTISPSISTTTGEPATA